MSNIGDKLIALTRQLYPTGRAFKMPDQSDLEALHFALSISEEQAYNDAVAVLFSILPDNENFTEADATDWERRLGLISNPAVSLADRKLAIIRKLNQPGVAKAKSNWRYLQQQLRAAGFDVYVYENIFDPYPYGDPEPKTPFEINGSTNYFISNQYGDYQYGDIQYGGRYKNFVANHIDETKDWYFDIGTSLRSTFFIGGATLGSFANVDVNRKDEFRQLILTLKPVPTVGFLFINYI